MDNFKPQIICDTKQKLYKHTLKHEQIKSLGYEIINCSLPCGDYQFFGKGNIVIDTKKDVIELANNIFHDHERFRNELILAQRNCIKLIILIEEVLPVGGLSNWESPIYKSNTYKHLKGEQKSKINPITLKKAMITMQKKYGVKFMFCDKKDTGKKIISILTEDY